MSQSFLNSGHLPEHIQADIEKAALGRECTGVLLAKRPTDPLSHLLALARSNAFRVLDRFIQADLWTDKGIQQARLDQHEVQRYFELVGWIISALEEGDEAHRRILELNEPNLTQSLTETYRESEQLNNA